MFKQLAQGLLKSFRLAAFAILAIAFGVILGDEVSERLLKQKLRQACYEQMAGGIPQEMLDAAAIVIEYKCRNAIP